MRFMLSLRSVMRRGYETRAVWNQEPGCALLTRLGVDGAQPAEEGLASPVDRDAVTIQAKAAGNTPDHFAVLSA